MNFRGLKRSGIFAVAAVLFAFSCATFATTPANAGKPRCTISGTKGPDKLFGTKGRDVICGFGGKDVIWGLTGNDIIYGGRGDDTIRAGKGNDHLYGQPNDDTLYAGLGNDFLDGGPGEDSLISGPGNNKCIDRATDTRTPGCDDQAPTVTSLTVDRTEVDTKDGPQTVKVTLQMTDDLAGIRREPDMTVHHPNNFTMRWVNFVQVSRDAMGGTWEGTFTLPQNSSMGHFDFLITAGDKQNNHAYIDASDLKKQGFPAGINQVGAGDESAPVLSEFTVDRTSFDTSAEPQTVNFSVRITDDMAGVGSDFWSAPVQVNLDSGDGGSRQVALELVSGDALDGIYEGSTTFPRYTPKRTWEIRLAAVDRVDNVGFLNTDQLKAAGKPYRLVQTDPGDSEPPVLHSVTVAPGPVDLSGSAEFEVAHLRVTDNLSGVKAGNIGVSVQVDESLGFSSWVERLEGTDLDGTYRSWTWGPSEMIPDGPHDIDVWLTDQAGNSRIYKAEDLAALGFDSTIETITTP